VNIAHERLGTTDVLHVAGRIDASSAPELEAELMSRVDAGDSSIIFNLADVDYISSAGLRVLLLGVKTLAAKNRKFALAAPNDDVMNVVKMTGFDKILAVHGTLEQALAEVE
jgi:anti-anti-sigma factor